jgi:hypothetical protein
VARGRRLDSGDVRARVRLGQCERAEDRLVEQRRQPLALLLVGAGDQHRQRAEDVRHDRGPDPGTAPAELFAEDRPVHRAEAGPAELLGDVGVHQPHLVRLRDHIGRVGLVLVVLGRLGADLLLRKLVRQLTQRALLVGQLEGDAGAGCLCRGHVPRLVFVD